MLENWLRMKIPCDCRVQDNRMEISSDCPRRVDDIELSLLKKQPSSSFYSIALDRQNAKNLTKQDIADLLILGSCVN